MAEFPAAVVVADVLVPVYQDGASYTFCQGEERYAFAFLTAEPFRKPAAAGIVPGEDGVGDGIDQCLQGEVTDIKRRSIQNSGNFRKDDP